MSRPHLVHAVTVPITAATFLRGQLRTLRARGFEVTVIASPGPELDEVAATEGVRTVAVPMAREPDPRRDVISLARMTRALGHLRPDLVVASTPKAGLLGSMAAFALRVPVRIYFLRGLRLETTSGRLRQILTATERLAARCATHVVTNSRSLERRVLELGLTPERKLLRIGAGSSNGVDFARFARTPERHAASRALRRSLGIDEPAIVVGFVGRLVEDKGVAELFEALAELDDPRLHLLVVGGDLAGDRLPAALTARIAATPHVHAVGPVKDPERFYPAMDLLAFPSYREGFPNVPLEAACAELPVVGFRATGVLDAVVDGVTGTLVAMKDAHALAAAIRRYADDPALRAAHGRAGAERAKRDFDREAVWGAWADALETLHRAARR